MANGDEHHESLAAGCDLLEARDQAAALSAPAASLRAQTPARHQ